MACHKSHVTYGPKLAQFKIELNADYAIAVYHLASKYAEGCMVEFLEGLVKSCIDNEFADELKADIEKIKEQHPDT